MSASPSLPNSGPSSTTPSGTAPVAPRKRPPVSIFAQKKKPIRKPGAAAASNGPQKPVITTNAAPSVANGSAKAATQDAQAENENNYSEFSIYITKDAFMQGRHHHAMKLQSRLGPDGLPIEVNPYREDQFTRPLHLHRRNARDKKEAAAELSDAASGADDKERELLNARRAERQAEREANQALIAPTGGEAKKPVRKKPQKKVEDVYYDENDPRQRQRAQLRYEEARPWHLEDFDSKNVWVGSYEEPLSETSVLFELDATGFRMVPVEKWYKFIQANRVNTVDSDAVEKHMGKKYKPPRWFLGTQAANDEERKRSAVAQREAQRAQMRRVDEDDEQPGYFKKEEYRADVDEIDFEFNDEFQDDDEGLIFGDQQDDDAKEIERKIREEMRSANLGGTGIKDEDRDWDEEEQKERREEQEEKRRTKRMRKQLIKKERKNEYDSESSRGEFSEDSDSEDSEEERERLEEERKQEEARKAAAEKSGASTKGTNTPTGRAEKKDLTRLATSLKRPGSPELSEASGNESSRKKAKGINGAALGAGRSLSPEAASRPKAPRSVGGAGSGSGSDTEAPRAGRPRTTVKHSAPGSPNSGTPAGSRAGSLSPQRKPNSTSATAAVVFPSLTEVRDAIPPEGIGIQDLVQMFKMRVLTRQADFITLVKQVGRQDQASRKIMRKT